MFHKKAVLKKFAILYSQEHTCVGISFLKNADLQVCSFIQKTPTQVTYCEIENFLRTPILKNICERLVLRLFLERFPTWTNNIGSEEDVFSKTKQKKNVLKLSSMKKLALLWFFIISFFSISPLHIRQHFPFIIKVDSSESCKTA